MTFTGPRKKSIVLVCHFCSLRSGQLIILWPGIRYCRSPFRTSSCLIQLTLYFRWRGEWDGGRHVTPRSQASGGMPGGRRGLVAPQNTFLENIIRRSSSQRECPGTVVVSPPPPRPAPPRTNLWPLLCSRQQLPVGQRTDRGLPDRVLQRDVLQDERLQPRGGHAEIMQVTAILQPLPVTTHRIQNGPFTYSVSRTINRGF